MNDLIYNTNWEFIIALIAIAISLYSIYLQRKHNTLAYNPIPVIVKYNYSSHLSIKVWNKGTGPLIIQSVKIANFSNLIDIIPIKHKELKFVEYINDFRGRAITPNDNLNMIEFKIRFDKSKKQIKEYDIALENIKNVLHNKIIEITYTDIFNNSKIYTSTPLNFKDSKD